MSGKKTKVLCIKALLTAVVMLATMSLQIPVPATSGYIHLGDGMIFIISVFFGWQYGMVAGAAGSAMADVFTGYAHWAPFTFVIKGLMGYVIGRLTESKGGHNFFTARNVLVPVLGGAIMVAGYLMGGTLIFGSFAVSLTATVSNLIQAGGSLALYYILGAALYPRRSFFKVPQ